MKEKKLSETLGNLTKKDDPEYEELLCFCAELLFVFM